MNKIDNILKKELIIKECEIEEVFTFIVGKTPVSYDKEKLIALFTEIVNNYSKYWKKYTDLFKVK